MIWYCKILLVVLLLMTLSACHQGRWESSWLQDERFDNVKREQVTFKTIDGVELTGFLYLPKDVAEDSLKSITVWNPIYPNAQTTCTNYALRDVSFLGFWNHICQFTFDYRGIGLSKGRKDKKKISIDLQAANAYLKQRFKNSSEIKFQGHSTAALSDAIKKLKLNENWHIYFRIFKPQKNRPVGQVIYLSDFYQWTSKDDSLARYLADSGYLVYGIDLLRFLMDGSMREPISIKQLRNIFFKLGKDIGDKKGIVLVGQRLGAAVALAATPNTRYLMGVVATDMLPTHQFQNPYVKTMLNMLDSQDYDLNHIASQLGTRRLYLIYDQSPWLAKDRLTRLTNVHFSRQEILGNNVSAGQEPTLVLAEAMMRGINFVRLEF